jgi:hypothetical protein
MDLDDFIIAVFCVIDEAVPRAIGGQRLRQRGPKPTLADSEVLTMEVVGASLGLEQDSALFAYVGQRYAHFFPALRTLHRTTFVRQAANLWRLNERLWQQVLQRVPHDPTCAIIDSFPLPVCPSARLPVRPRLWPPSLPRSGRLRQGYAGAPDLLGLARPCPPGVARGDRPLLRRAGQHARTAGAPGLGRAGGGDAARRPQLRRLS